MTEPPRAGNNRLTLAWYGSTVFISSALLLVLEMTAGRLLAPYVGVSLYTWTSIIGVILAGLSLGNWIGGLMADRGAGEGATGIVLTAGSIACFAILFLLMVVAGGVQESGLSLLSSSFIYVMTLFFVPAALLGIVTPLLTTLALRLEDRPGHVVGRMHALAALGSIAGTFLTGYWLIQVFGTKNIIIGASACLFALAVPFLWKARRVSAFTVIAAFATLGIALATQGVQGFASPCDEESNYYCIRVVDEHDDRGEIFARSLILDHMSHSTNARYEPGLLLVPYVHAMDELVLYHFEPRPGSPMRYFFAGGGAYTHPRAVRARDPEAEITVAELDPMVTGVAESMLYLDPAGIAIEHGDARVALLNADGRVFDVVVTDVFHDIAVPYHLTTVEYARLVKSRLSKDGLYLLNVVDAFPNPLLVKAMVKTLEQEFRHVDVWLERPPDVPTRLTWVISASDAHPPPRMLRASDGSRAWYPVTDPVVKTGTPMTDVPVLTDDLAPVESLVSSLFTTAAGL